VNALGKLTGKKIRAQRGRLARVTAAAACQSAGGLRKPWRPQRGASGQGAGSGKKKSTRGRGEAGGGAVTA
jgi:hypothetical protein